MNRSFLLPDKGGEARPTFLVTGGVLTTSGIGFKVTAEVTLGLDEPLLDDELDEFGLAASDLSL